MTYLLDTHTIPLVPDDTWEGACAALDLIEDPVTELAVSLATPWEIAIKVAQGKLDANEMIDEFDSILRRGRFNMLLPSLTQVIASSRLPLHHRDPFDRLMAAQALELNLTLLSCDEFFDRYGVRRIWS